jgi:uncharacterized protein with FMN-binding domain
MTARHPGRRPAGLVALLAGVGIVVAAKAATGQPAHHEVALPPAVTTPPSSTPAGTTTQTATPATPTAPATPHTVDGAVVGTPYGPVQVAVTFAGTRITDVRAVRTPSAASRSVELAAQATPVLRHEVLAAQSARIDSVSGATYTSDGYARSVQYAIDHASG